MKPSAARGDDMSEEAGREAIEIAASQAKSDRHTEHARGFVVVKWMDRYSYYATPIPQADLERIVNTQTRAEIVARYACVHGKWIRLPLESRPQTDGDGSVEQRVDGLE